MYPLKLSLHLTKKLPHKKIMLQLQSDQIVPGYQAHEKEYFSHYLYWLNMKGKWMTLINTFITTFYIFNNLLTHKYIHLISCLDTVLLSVCHSNECLSVNARWVQCMLLAVWIWWSWFQNLLNKQNILIMSQDWAFSNLALHTRSLKWPYIPACNGHKIASTSLACELLGEL